MVPDHGKKEGITIKRVVIFLVQGVAFNLEEKKRKPSTTVKSNKAKHDKTGCTCTCQGQNGSVWKTVYNTMNPSIILLCFFPSQTVK